jgi:hypothetical protein
VTGPSTTNQLASIVNSVLKNLIEGAGGGALETVLIAQYPWLGLPFVKQLFEFILEKATGLIYQNAAEAATKVIIDAQVNVEEGAANAAFQNLQLAVASGDPEAIAQASADLDSNYRKLINFDGSASP